MARSAELRRALCQPPNKQLERTVTRHRVRAACAAFHCAPAARWTRARAAAQLRRSAAKLAPVICHSSLSRSTLTDQS